MTRRHLAIMGFILALAACGPLYQTVNDYYPPDTPQARVCVGQCGMQKGACYQQCDMQELHCRERVDWQAERDFRDYVRQRRHEGSKIKKSEDDFRYYGQCAPDSCRSSCDMIYDGCFTACGGAIHPRQVCTAFCNQ